ncbi:hypothetical protein VNI00_005276 [Paramarasmius palmivorus]|uniref:G protein-coupled receptor n=1 Tax=Paramarasmius palmivorus TaxID=297713 RepID=A0AAW0DF39_9AGAR
MNAAAYAELMFHESAPTNSIEAGKNSEERLVKRIGATGAAAVISYIIANIIGDAIMIWRCYCIWGSRIKVIIIPTILCLGSNALAIVDTVKANPLHPVLGGDKSLYTLSPPQILISFLFVTMFANALLTLMIAGRIFYITRKAIRLLGNHVRRTYRTIIAIVLESGMLYPFALILYGAVLLSMLVKGGDRDESNRNRLAADLIAQVMAYSIIQFVGIAPTLIVVRTGLGISVENVESTVATIRAELSDLGEITPEVHHTSRICFRNSVNITEPPDIEQELELEVPPPGKSIKSQRRTTSNCSLSEPAIT